MKEKGKNGCEDRGKRKGEKQKQMDEKNNHRTIKRQSSDKSQTNQKRG